MTFCIEFAIVYEFVHRSLLLLFHAALKSDSQRFGRNKVHMPSVLCFDLSSFTRDFTHPVLVGVGQVIVSV